MEDIRLTMNDLIFYFAIANTILGLLFGIFPLVVGLKTGNRKYGFIGLIAGLLGGLIAGFFLSFPLALIFTWLALRPSVARPDDGEFAPAEAS